MYIAKTRDVEVPMLGSLLGSNRVHVERAAEFVLAQGGRRVGLIGLSFKAGTDDLRESPLVTLAETLIGKGLELRIYDPHVNVAVLMGANKRYIDDTFRISRLCSSRIARTSFAALKPSSSERCSRMPWTRSSRWQRGPVHSRLGWNARRAAAPRRVSRRLLVGLGVLG